MLAGGASAFVFPGMTFAVFLRRQARRFLLSVCVVVFPVLVKLPFFSFLGTKKKLVSFIFVLEKVKSEYHDVLFWQQVSEYTGFPEMMDGRVKTLHPSVHGGIMHVRGNEEHEEAMKSQGMKVHLEGVREEDAGEEWGEG